MTAPAPGAPEPAGVDGGLTVFGNLGKLPIMPIPKARLHPGAEAPFHARAAVLKAMAHPTRLFLADRLRDGEKCVRELTAMVGADISTVSKHLAILKSAGIVLDRKQGLQVFYSLRFPCVLDFFTCVESVIRAMGGVAARPARSNRRRSK